MTRTSKGRFAAGHSGNPGGRPRVPGEIRAMARGGVLDALIALRDVMMSRRSPAAARVQAAAVVLRFAYGTSGLDGGEADDTVAASSLTPPTPIVGQFLDAFAQRELEAGARIALQVNLGDKQVSVVGAPCLPDTEE